MTIRTMDTFTDFAARQEACFPGSASVAPRTFRTEEGITVTEAAPAGVPAVAVKHDDGKARWDLLPPELMEQTALVLAFGAGKYGNRNWEKGMSWGRPFAALMRHMWAWWRQENGGKDAETGYSHLAHAACCLAFLIAYEARQTGEDDRPAATGRIAA